MNDSHDLLTTEEEIALAQRIEQGDTEAKHTFVNANQRLVVWCARKYYNSPVDHDDLIQEGNVGLIRAVEKFDWRRGCRFSTYAAWWIRQAMSQTIARSSSIRFPTDAEYDGVVSLDAPVGEEGSVLGDFVRDDEAVDPLEWAERKDVVERVRVLVEGLPDVERLVLGLRFGFVDGVVRTLVETAGAVGYSVEGVRKVEGRGLRRVGAAVLRAA